MNSKYSNIYKNIQYTLTLTYNANKQIEKLIYNDNANDTIGLRISIKNAGCAGFSYIFNKVNKENIDKTDLIFENKKNMKIFIPFKIIPLINGSELDYIQNGLNYTFKFKNPNARHLCGCGESFNV